MISPHHGTLQGVFLLSGFPANPLTIGAVSRNRWLPCGRSSECSVPGFQHLKHSIAWRSCC